MNIEVCIIDNNQYQIAKSIFSDCPDFIIIKKSITEASHPVIVAAGNSFGEMNGGVDRYINYHLSLHTPDKYIQSDVKNVINNKFYGELPVGQSIIVSTSHPFHKFLIYTPTMRVAEDVHDSLNAYLAFRSAIVLAMNCNIRGLSTPLFCTGAGFMNVSMACKQMKEAYISVANKTLSGGDWKTFHEHHRYLKNLR